MSDYMKLRSERPPGSRLWPDFSAIVGGMADPIFEHPRLAAIYDALDPDPRFLATSYSGSSRVMPAEVASRTRIERRA
jgi:hypothetical protein